MSGLSVRRRLRGAHPNRSAENPCRRDSPEIHEKWSGIIVHFCLPGDLNAHLDKRYTYLAPDLLFFQVDPFTP